MARELAVRLAEEGDRGLRRCAVNGDGAAANAGFCRRHSEQECEGPSDGTWGWTVRGETKAKKNNSRAPSIPDYA